MLIPAPNTVVATGANTVVTTGANTVVTTGANTVDNETTHTSRLEYYGQHTWQWQIPSPQLDLVSRPTR